MKKAFRFMGAVAVSAGVVAVVVIALVNAVLAEMDYRSETNAAAIRERIQAQAEDRRVATLYGWAAPVEKAVENPAEPRLFPCPIF